MEWMADKVGLDRTVSYYPSRITGIYSSGLSWQHECRNERVVVMMRVVRIMGGHARLTRYGKPRVRATVTTPACLEHPTHRCKTNYAAKT